MAAHSAMTELGPVIFAINLELSHKISAYCRDAYHPELSRRRIFDSSGHEVP